MNDDTGGRCSRNGGSARRILLICEMAKYCPEPLRRLEDAGFELVEGYSAGNSAEALERALQGIWATVAGSEPYTRQVLEEAHDLQAIARCGVGFDAIDVAAATDRGVAVLITPNANFDTVADFALTLMLACLRRLVLLEQRVRAGEWDLREPSRDLHGATVGIVGLGRIGRAVARRLRGFDCRILGVEPLPHPECTNLGIELMPLHEALPQVDVLTLHVPRVPETIGLIGAAEIAGMKRDAVLVNTSRGGIVDEAALIEALQTGALAGAALDVFEREPLAPDSPLLTCPNLIVTPHVSSFTHEAVRRTMEEVVENLLAVASGEVPAGCINPEAMVPLTPHPPLPQGARGSHEELRYGQA